VLAITTEELVRALPGQGDRHVLRSKLGKGEEAQRRELRHGLVHRPHEVLELDALLGHRELDLVVIGPEDAGDAARVRELVELSVLGEADREGAHRLAVGTRHQRHDQARVQAAAQHRAQRHVAHQPQPDRLVELLEEPLGVLVDGQAGAVRRRLRVGPVLLDAEIAALDHEPVPGRQLAHAGERRHRRREIAEGEVRGDRLVIEADLDHPARQQALELGSEHEPVAATGVVERLDPHPVASEHGAPAFGVDHRDRELASQVLGERVAVLLVEVREDLGVAAAVEPMPSQLELRTDLVVVVELAVLRSPDGLVLIGERLVAARQVDDAQSTRAKGVARPHLQPAVVGSPMLHRIGHRRKRLGHCDVAPGAVVDLDHSADSAHTS
jgi:hypothetical protein